MHFLCSIKPAETKHLWVYPLICLFLCQSWENHSLSFISWSGGNTHHSCKQKDPFGERTAFRNIVCISCIRPISASIEVKSNFPSDIFLVYSTKSKTIFEKSLLKNNYSTIYYRHNVLSCLSLSFSDPYTVVPEHSLISYALQRWVLLLKSIRIFA